eukprot:CAMPEP_0182560160 /NCGR_PEP_ID=MMETSP1324-20130603/2982_1 /TAXON_ID=236786 /ORGANISM="Florenciella sp., Strain RCC1587" /LENGTH=688 /DNA_ID=CAMNT_0024772495 /DNA_START=258 /DNA_END=2324 /DNA_ORIENTATION=+
MTAAVTGRRPSHVPSSPSPSSARGAAVALCALVPLVSMGVSAGHVPLHRTQKPHVRGHHRHRELLDRIDWYNHEHGHTALYREYEQLSYEEDQRIVRAIEARRNRMRQKKQKKQRQRQRQRQRVLKSKINDDYGFEDVDYTSSVTTTTADFSADVSFVDKNDDTKTYPIIVDTGSSNLAVAVKQCSTCGVGETDLDLDLDKNYSITVDYGESSESTFWEGYRAETTVSFDDALNGSDVSATVYLAGITETSTGDEAFFSGENNNGIMGLAFSALSEDYCYNDDCDVSSTPILDTLMDDGTIKEAFSVQLCGEPQDMHGFLNLGGYEPTHMKDSLNWTTAEKTSTLGEYGYWLSYMVGVRVADKSVSFSKSVVNDYGGALIDTGTTEIMLPSSTLGSSIEDSDTVLKELYDKYDGDMSSTELKEFLEEGECMSRSKLDGLPTLYLELDGMTLSVEHIHYVLPCYDTDSGDFADSYGFGIAEGNPAIVGNIALNGYVTVFDTENYRIGFAEGKNCAVWYDSDDEAWYEETWAEVIWWCVGIGVVVAGLAWYCGDGNGRVREFRAKRAAQREEAARRAAAGMSGEDDLAYARAEPAQAYARMSDGNKGPGKGPATHVTGVTGYIAPDEGAAAAPTTGAGAAAGAGAGAGAGAAAGDETRTAEGYVQPPAQTGITLRQVDRTSGCLEIFDEL